MHPELAHFHALENALADCEHLLLHLRGPVCDLSVRPVTAVTGRIRDLLASQGILVPRPCARPASRMRSCGSSWRPAPAWPPRAEAEICQKEILAAAAAQALPGHPEPAGRPGLGQHHRRRVPGGDPELPGPPVPVPDRPGAADHRTARRGPGLLEDQIPILQAAQLLGMPPAACAVVASTPDSIRAARQAGARAIGYACTAAAGDQLTAAGADASTASMTESQAPPTSPNSAGGTTVARGPPWRTVTPRGRNRDLGRPLPDLPLQMRDYDR